MKLGQFLCYKFLFSTSFVRWPYLDFGKVLRTISGSGARYIWFISGVFALFSFLLCLYIVPLPKVLASRPVAKP